MSGQTKQTLLATEIAAALNGTARTKRASRLFASPASRILLTGVALATLQPGNAAALGIGELKVTSALGQPFIATTTARTGPGEILGPDCVGAVAGMLGGRFSTVPLNTAVGKPSGSGEYPVRITSSAPMYEPMYEIQLKVSCPGVMALARDYVVMLNIGMTNPQAQTITLASTSEQSVTAKIRPVAPTVTKPKTRQVTPGESLSVASTGAPENQYRGDASESNKTLANAPSLDAPNSSIPGGGQYRVQRDDTLFTIAQRIEGRAGVGFRQAADIIFRDNPSAFIGDNPDLIKMGFVITIPSAQALSDAAEGRESTQVAAVPMPEADAASATAPVSAPGEQAAADSVAEQPSPVQSAESAPVARDDQLPDSRIAVQNSDATANQTESSALDAGMVSEPQSTAQDTTAEAAATSGLAVDAASGSEADAEVSEVAPATVPQAMPRVVGETAEPESATAQETAAVAVAAAPATAVAKPNELLSAGSGMLAGAFLAALLLGRGLLVSWLPAPLRRRKQALHNQEDQSDTLVNPDIATAEISAATPEVPGEQTAAIAAPEPDVIAASSPGSADLNPDLDTEAEQDSTEALAADAAANEADHDSPEFPAATADVAPANETPRISLHDSTPPPSAVDFDMSEMEEPLEHTSRYAEPSLLGEDKPAEHSELDNTGTMRNLFATQENETPESSEPDVTSTMHDIFGDEPDFLDDHAATEEIPRLGNSAMDSDFAHVDIDDTSSLQSLSESVASGSSDDEMSKTLTQALGLLERDYEDELTNSQIIEQKDIQKAFAEQARKER